MAVHQCDLQNVWGGSVEAASVDAKLDRVRIKNSTRLADLGQSGYPKR